MRFGQPFYLWALLVAMPAVAGLFYWSWRVKQKLTRQFIRARLLNSLTVGLQPNRQIFRMALLTLAVGAALLALARPQWGYVWEETHVKGLDIIIAIDTSRSMLAQDVVPNRLERAKYAAYDLMRLAKTDRLGLIAFAGDAFLQSPLTLDDQAFRQGVEALYAGIIPQGGTSLSAAIRTAQQAFEKNSDNHKVLVLFTDGEDHDQEAETIAAAKDAAQSGIHIFTVGVGTREGRLLQVQDPQGNLTTIKDDDGNPVISHLNETLLRQIATDASGFYLPLQGANTMETLYARGLAPLPRTESASRRTRVYQERYHWFLGFALACLLIEFLMPESPRRSRRAESKPASRTTTPQTIAAVLCLLLVTLQTVASPSGAYHDYQSGNFKAAADEYDRLSQQDTNDYRLHYDAGTAAYRAKQLDKAEKQFMATLGSPTVAPDVQTQERTYYNLGNTEYRIGEPLTDADKKEERWQTAIDSYTQALRLNTNDLDARNNLAYVKQRLEQLKQQQQQQQQNKQNKNQKDKNKNKDQQQQSQQNQQNQKNQQQQQQQEQQQSAQQKQSGQDKDQQKEQQQQQAQQQKDQQQQQEQAQGSQEKDKEKQEAQEAAAAGRMTPDEARQILAEDKDNEKALIFAPDNKQPPPAQPGKFKDW